MLDMNLYKKHNITTQQQSIEEQKIQEQIVQSYREEVKPLLRYLPWLEEKSGRKMLSSYAGEGIAGHSLTIPVYDSTLMSFVKEVSRTKLMDRNYRYIYSRNRIRTVADEKAVIEKATIREMNFLCGILSKYILGGMTKTTVWSEGMEQGIYLLVLRKMKKLLEFWDGPLA